jgi:hypothetical protein
MERIMGARKMDMQRLRVQRDRLLFEIEALRNKVAGIEMAMALLSPGEAPSDVETARAPRIRLSVKSFVLDLLSELGTLGLNAATAVEIGQRRGVHLDRQSVSSLLSRLKNEGVVVYEGERYKLPRFAGQKSPETEGNEGAPLLRAVNG